MDVKHVGEKPYFVQGQTDQKMVEHSPLLKALNEQSGGQEQPRIDLSMTRGGLQDYGMAPQQPDIVKETIIRREPYLIREQSQPSGADVIAGIIANRGGK